MRPKIKVKKNSTGTSGDSFKDLENSSGPEFDYTGTSRIENSQSSSSSFFSEKIQEATDSINRIDTKLTDLETNYNKTKDELSKQSTRNIEVIGIFAAILALLIIDTSIVKSVGNFLPALLLIVAMTCSLSIFVALIHKFFGQEKLPFGSEFWVPMTVLSILVVFGTCLYGFGIKMPMATIQGRDAVPAPSQ